MRPVIKDLTPEDLEILIDTLQTMADQYVKVADIMTETMTVISDMVDKLPPQYLERIRKVSKV